MKHGGDLAAAEAAFGRPAKGWLDLSTGVNPHAYPAPAFSTESLTRLPDPEHLRELLAIARRAYGWKPETAAVAGPGAQALIQLLPYLRVRGSVLVVGPTYAEHAYLWARAGHQVREAWSLAHAEDSQVVVMVNPDNPSGRTTDPDVLARLAADLARRDGLLVVDESFADVSVETALAGRVGPKGLVVLRSFGKFYGLPGLRLGFAAGDAEMIGELAGELGPWPVCGPAIEAARAALADDAWAVATRLQLTVEAMKLEEILNEAGFDHVRGCDLFRTVRHQAAGTVHRQLARAGVWCRAFDDRPDQLRFGLPPDDDGFERLKAELRSALKSAA